jgi:hypothetical protein
MNITGNQAVIWPSPKLGYFLWQVVDDSSIGTWINTSKEDINVTEGELIVPPIHNSRLFMPSFVSVSYKLKAGAYRVRYTAPRRWRAA